MPLGPAGLAFALFTAQPWYMRGSLRTCEGGESIARQIRDPVTELIVTRRDEATALSVEGVADGEPGFAAVAVFGEVWGL